MAVISLPSTFCILPILVLIVTKNDGKEDSLPKPAHDVKDYVKYGHGATCTRGELQKIEKAEPQLKSSCPNHFYMKYLLEASVHKDHATVMFVGCNKGEEFVSSMESWSGNTSYNVTQYSEKMLPMLTTEGRHFCNKQSVHYLLPSQKLRPIRGYCMEPLQSNINLLNEVMTNMSFNMHDQIHLIRAAADAFNGNASFPATTIMGKESLGLSGNEGAIFDGWSKVNLINLDSFIESEKIDTVDWLSIDTEGHDARVLLGLLNSLSKQKVRFFEFETHYKGPWIHIDLEYVTDMLDEFDYDCYWEGEQLYRLTGCLTKKMVSKKHFANVLCILRSEMIAHKAINDAWEKSYSESNMG